MERHLFLMENAMKQKLSDLEKRVSFSSVAKSGRNKKTFLQKCEEWRKKIFGLTEIFVKYF